MEPGSLRLVVGLGNPGRDYEGTRHNIGFEAVDILAQKLGAVFGEHREWRCLLARAHGVCVMKPLTFMNLSGEAFARVTRFFKIAAEECLIVLDDVALPLGRLRLRASGSAGGHNGLQSILDHAGTNSVARLRIGVGAASDDLSAHVLGRFTPEEKTQAAHAAARAADAIKCIMDRGFAAAMNTYNKPEPINP
jgi:PTH1 family peptidyl-tRNA hydrolase